MTTHSALSNIMNDAIRNARRTQQPYSFPLLVAYNNLLTKNGFCALPDDYAEFMKTSGGLQGKNYVLLGLDPMKANGSFSIEPVFPATQKAVANGLIDKSSLILGCTMADTVLAYNGQKKQYAMLDANTGDELKTYPNLASFVKYMGDIAPKPARLTLA